LSRHARLQRPQARQGGKRLHLLGLDDLSFNRAAVDA
jgi:hypothetical protein